MARVQKSVRLEEATARAWDRWCTERGPSFTATIEALGQLLAEGEWLPPEMVIDRARAVDRRRGSRR